MLTRVRTDERRAYSREERELILKKSGGRCAHCGISLTLSTMEKDHAIPISKGGSSDVENIVPLCSKCNKEKSMYVVNPRKYFKYLKKPYLKEIEENYEKYLQEVGYYEVDNIFPLDYVSCSGRYAVFLRNAVRASVKTAVFKRAVYSDLDDIYWMFKNYLNTDYGRTFREEFKSPEDIKMWILSYYTYGCIMFFRSTSGSIAEVVFFRTLPRAISKKSDVVEGKIILDLNNTAFVVYNPELDLLDTNKKMYSPAYYKSCTLQEWYFGITVSLLENIMFGMGFLRSANFVYFEYPTSDERVTRMLEICKAPMSSRSDGCNYVLISMTATEKENLRLTKHEALRLRRDLCKYCLESLNQSQTFQNLINAMMEEWDLQRSDIMYISELSDQELEIQEKVSNYCQEE